MIQNEIDYNTLEVNDSIVTSNKTLLDIIAFASHKKLLSREEEHELFVKYYNKQVSEWEILQNYILLVYGIALKYARTLKYSDINDLFQEGIIGCLHAISKYDISLNTRFSTYACHWIKQHITRSIVKVENELGVSYCYYIILSRFQKYINKIEIDFDRAVSEAEIDSFMREWCTNNKINYQSLKSAYDSYTTTSLDKSILFDSDFSLSDTLESDMNIEDIILRNEKYETLYEAMKQKLSKRELDVICRRFGFYDKIETYASIGESYNLSKERIRQIEKSALRKLRRSALMRRLN